MKSKSLTTFVLIRHGHTAANEADLFTGQRTDIDLSPLGLRQAQKTAAQLRKIDLQITAAFSSPLKRTLDTANILADPLGLDVEVDERLSEFDFGELEGKSTTDVHAENPEIRQLWKPDQTEPLPGGESAAAVADRIHDFFRETIARFDRAATILVVGHMGSFAMGLARLLDDAEHATDYAVNNCSITLLEWGERPRLITFNQIDHIQHIRDR